MATIDELKEQQAPPTPLFLFDCVLSSGTTERWSTHAVTFSGNAYNARLLKHNLFQLRAGSNDGLDGSAKITVTLANADSHFSEIERETGFKGSQVTITFLFFDLVGGVAASESRVVFRGTANPPQEITESAFTVTFNNRLSLQRIKLPEVQILRRCPWMFPADLAQREEALDGGAAGKYSALYKCGYSADVSGGVGNLNSGVAYTSCDFTRTSCIARGMFDQDSSSNVTARFGGLEFVPPQIQVRAFGQKTTSLSAVLDNLALYSDPVPLVYGTAWYAPPIVFARNDGNLTRMEVLLGMGEIERVIMVIVNGIEIPQAQSGVNMTGTGWWQVVTAGTRSGSFDPNFTDGSGNPLGDPYGSMAMMSVVVPNAISNGQTLPSIQVLMDGLKLEQFSTSGVSLGESFSNNPAWVLLDVLRRSGWLTTDVDLTSFASAAATCAAAIETTDLNGNTVAASLYECNLVIQDLYSGAEIAVGIKNGAALILTYANGGLLTLRVENTMALQQPSLPDGSNSTEMLDGGWPAYEFSDGSADFSGLARNANGDPSIMLSAQLTASTPNRLTIEFQDEFNDYQQDSLSLVDVDDALLTQRLVTAAYSALGIPNFDQATRVLQLQLNQTIDGYQYIDFETTVKGIGIAPGDLITVTYIKEGLARQPFRVTQLAPGRNYQTVQVTAQWHDDAWYSSTGAAGTGTRRQSGSGGIPRPLVGTLIDSHGLDQYGVTETTVEGSDGSFAVELAVAFTPPASPVSTGVTIPLVSLEAAVSTTGGTIAGGQTLYYAVSALDGSGGESGLSFSIPASIPAGTSTNEVTLSGISVSSGTSGLNAYRGPNPSDLLLIAPNIAVATTYIDTGAMPELIGPPDENYDHANFYWREELQPETVANVFSSTTIGNSTLGMLTDDFVGAVVRITRGTGATEEVAVISNTATTLTLTPAWTIVPDSTSYFVVANSTWNFGGSSSTSPVQIEVPNQTGLTVEISGRSANALDQESAEELNPMTRWQIGGGSGGGVDADVPAMPVFGLNLAGQGAIELVGISFTDLTNTHTISAGTLTLFYWNELDSPSAYTLASGIGTSDASVTLVTAAGPGRSGSLIQIDGEILRVTAVSSGGLVYSVTRAVEGTAAAIHAAAAVVYHLSSNVTIMPFVDDFFGSPSSGSYTCSVFLPDVRVGAAEFFVTNVRGNSPAATLPFGTTADEGLRTLSGGQLSIQVEGYLAVQTGAAPPLVVENALAARDIFAVVNQAPYDPVDSAPVTLTLRQGSSEYCTLSIAAGSTTSNVVNGFGLAPLAAEAQVSLDITGVPTSTGSLPGRDLTVVIRL